MSKIIKQGNARLLEEKAREIKLKSFAPILTDEEQPQAEPFFAEEERRAIVQNAEQEAASIIEAANREKADAERIIAEQRRNWENERQELADSAFQEGFESGQAAGRVDGYTEYLQAIDEAKSTVDNAKAAFHAHIEEAEGVILELALAVAEKVIHETIESDPGKFLPLVKNVIKEVRDYKEVQIQVHPSKYEALLEDMDELRAVFPHDVQLYIYPDGDLPEDACVIESENGKIDAGVDTQLVEIKKALVEMLGELA